MKIVIAQLLVKIATEADKYGKYSEADKIDAMVKSLCERVGLDPIISIADELDIIGLHEEASKIDELIKTAKCPQCGSFEFDVGGRSSVCEDCGYPMVRIKRDPNVKKIKKVDAPEPSDDKADNIFEE